MSLNRPHRCHYIVTKADIVVVVHIAGVPFQLIDHLGASRVVAAIVCKSGKRDEEYQTNN